jgi:pimeloyl-ACP methyl ester carboxylesterase
VSKVFIGLIFAVLTLVATTAPAAESGETSENLKVGADTYVKYVLPVKNGPAIEYYISKPARPSSLILYIQGSGCAPAFVETQPGVYASTVFSLTTTAHKGGHAVMIVDKPYAEKQQPRAAGTANYCSAAFNRYFAVEPWVRQISLALNHALKRPWVKQGRTLVIGISEGATTAAALAAADDAVTDVALVGGSGPGQLFDFVAGAYASGKNDTERLQGLQSIEARLRDIQAAPEDASKFAWGHPYKRWSSFFKASSLRNLMRSRARVYLVSGMADTNVPILSTEILYSELASAGRDVRFRRVPDADHMLLPRGADFAESFPLLESEYARILDWFDAQE